MLMPEVFYLVVRGKLRPTTSCSPPRLAFSEDAQTSTIFYLIHPPPFLKCLWLGIRSFQLNFNVGFRHLLLLLKLFLFIMYLTARC